MSKLPEQFVIPGTDGDFTIAASGGEPDDRTVFKVHRLLLASVSPVFAAMSGIGSLEESVDGDVSRKKSLCVEKEVEN